MKPLFKCDYCNFTGTEEQVKAHEGRCLKNYDIKSCLTCKHKTLNPTWTQITCACGISVPNNEYIKECDKYETDKSGSTSLGGLFDALFKGAK